MPVRASEVTIRTMTPTTATPSGGNSTTNQNTDPAQQAALAQQRQRQRVSAVFAMPDLSVPGEALSAAEAAFFVEHGFLVKSALLPKKRCDAALARSWTHLLEHVPLADAESWRPDPGAPATWLNPRWGEMPAHPESGPFQGRQPLEYYGRIVKLHDIGGADFLVDLVPNHPAVQSVARTLLGDSLTPSTLTRGVYAVFPTRRDDATPDHSRISGAALGPHTDQVCQQLNVCAYLDDVQPRNGGFTIYPGSHRIMYAQHRFGANWSPRATFADAQTEVAQTIEPLEIVAPQGSVVFWHGRAVHSSGIHTGADIRWAVFADFTEDRPVLDEDTHRRLGQYEWFKNAKLFRDDDVVEAAALSDPALLEALLWRGWKVAQRATAA